MSTIPRVPSAIPGEAENFATVTAHAPEMIMRFFVDVVDTDFEFTRN